MINNIFLLENTTKLISDNVFPSDKIRQYIEIPYTLIKDESTNKHQQDEQKNMQNTIKALIVSVARFVR